MKSTAQAEEMAKGKEKSDSLTQSLRSRKRECPSKEIPQTDNVQAFLHQQDTKENTTTVVATSLQCPQSPVHERPLMFNQQDQAEVQSCITRQNDSTEEKHTEETSKSLTNVTVKDFEAKEVPTVVTLPTWVGSVSDIEGFTVHTDNETSNSGMKESPLEEGIGLQFQTCTNQLKVLLPTSEDGDASSAMILEEQLGTRKDSQCNLETNYESKQEDPCNTYMSDIKESTKETASGLPARKKRRMGMCGLTEKERSHFLQTRKLLNGQSGTESVEKEISKNIYDDVAQEEFVSSVFIPPSTSLISEDDVTEIKSQSSHSGKNDRAEAEVHNTVTTPDGSSYVCCPGSEGKSCETEGGTKFGPEQPDKARSEPPAQVKHEIQESTTEIMTQTSEKQRKDGKAKFTNADCSAAISFYTYPTQNDETGKDESKSLSLLVQGVNRTRSESEEKEVVDVIDGTESQRTSSTVTKPDGVNCGSFEFCEAAVPPIGTKRKDRCYPEEESSRPTVNTIHIEMSDTPDPFGSGCLNYVSDSQLNAIVLLEEEVMENKKSPHSADCYKDATYLIYGLTQELSSLNHKVMATHREMENLRHGSKTSRSSLS